VYIQGKLRGWVGVSHRDIHSTVQLQWGEWLLFAFSVRQSYVLITTCGQYEVLCT